MTEKERNLATGKPDPDDGMKIIMLDPGDCRKAVSRVNIHRLYMVERNAEIELFPSPGQESYRSRPKRKDSPALQILFKLRDQYLDAAAPKERRATKDDPAPEPDPPDPLVCSRILTQMAKIALEINAEANRVSTELQAIAQHEDHMKLEAKKMGQGDDLTWAEIVARQAKRSQIEKITTRDGGPDHPNAIFGSPV